MSEYAKRWNTEIDETQMQWLRFSKYSYYTKEEKNTRIKKQSIVMNTILNISFSRCDWELLRTKLLAPTEEEEIERKKVKESNAMLSKNAVGYRL